MHQNDSKEWKLTQGVLMEKYGIIHVVHLKVNHLLLALTPLLLTLKIFSLLSEWFKVHQSLFIQRLATVQVRKCIFITKKMETQYLFTNTFNFQIKVSRLSDVLHCYKDWYSRRSTCFLSHLVSLATKCLFQTNLPSSVKIAVNTNVSIVQTY